MLCKVINTRPAALARSLTAHLSQNGFTCLDFPLIEIIPLINPESKAILANIAVSKISQFALIIFVSPTAIDIFFKNCSNTYKWITPIAVPGLGSLTALSKYQITPENTLIINPPENSQTFDAKALLLALKDSKLNLLQLKSCNGKVLVVQGVGGEELITKTLKENGIKTKILEIYKRVAPNPDILILNKLEQTIKIAHCWILTSTAAVSNLNLLHQSLPWLKLQAAVVTHPKIFEYAKKIGFKKLTLVKDLSNNNSIADLIQKLKFF